MAVPNGRKKNLFVHHIKIITLINILRTNADMGRSKKNHVRKPGPQILDFLEAKSRKIKITKILIDGSLRSFTTDESFR